MENAETSFLEGGKYVACRCAGFQIGGALPSRKIMTGP
jgi:hypothetical protein